MATRFTGFPPSVQSAKECFSQSLINLSICFLYNITCLLCKESNPSTTVKSASYPRSKPSPNPDIIWGHFIQSGNSVTCNGGSPWASPSSKPGQQPTLPLGPLQQQQAKNSPSITNTNNRSIPSSILGHPHSNKVNPHQPQKQPQLFFNSLYNIQSQNSQPTVRYYHQQQQQQQSSSSSGMLSLPSSSLTSDPSKAAAKVLTTSMASHPFMSAAFPGNAMASSVSVKPEKKQSITGNDILHACQKPEKR